MTYTILPEFARNRYHSHFNLLIIGSLRSPYSEENLRNLAEIFPDFIVRGCAIFHLFLLKKHPLCIVGDSELIECQSRT